ncbi:MAG TPA: cupin domain-containing protein, partial [Anaerolineaceae bacterium]|nr:cupin domain-containing protein [Anaerolineaceae bacterium]
MTHSDMSANGSKPLAVYSFFMRANEHYPEHKHPHHELIVVQRGRLRIRLSGVEHIAGPGDIALYSANSLHEEWAEDGEPVLTWVCVFHSEGFDV